MSRKDGRPRSVAITLPLDPMPCLDAGGWRSSSGHVGVKQFGPRPGYSQRTEDYA